jgi:succinate-acetate transporter protein
MSGFWIAYIVYVFFFAVASASIMGAKNRSSAAGFFLGLLFGVFGLLVVIGMPKKDKV